jgi:hypothetical protein
MIEIVLYDSHYQKGVEAMVAQIDLEFAESIFAPAQALSPKEQPPMPEAYWVALSGNEVVDMLVVFI